MQGCGLRGELELLLVHRKIRAASYTHRGTDIPALFAEWDIDNDGTLTRDEFYVAIKKLVSGITPPEFEQLCDIIDTEKTGGIDVVMIQNFIEKYSKGWKRRQVKRGEEEHRRVDHRVEHSPAACSISGEGSALPRDLPVNV